jgi:hypothetical protein
VDRNGKPVPAGQLFFHSLDDVMRHERFAVVLSDVAVGFESSFTSQLSGELSAVVVLDDEDLSAV